MEKIKPGEKAKAFTLPDVNGREHSFSDEESGIVAVIFSCNHCPYVRAWEDRMVEIQSDYKDRGVQFLVINSNDASKYPADSPSNMKKRADEKGFNFPYLRDETQEVALAYGAERTPEVFLFHDGSLVYHGAIDDNYDDPDAVKQHYLREALDAVLAGGKPDPAETGPVGCTIKWK